LRGWQHGFIYITSNGDLEQLLIAHNLCKAGSQPSLLPS
jgi:hypothetical protein